MLAISSAEGKLRMDGRFLYRNRPVDEAMMRETPLNYHPLKNDATTSIAPDDLITFMKSCGHAPRIVAVSDA